MSLLCFKAIKDFNIFPFLNLHNGLQNYNNKSRQVVNLFSPCGGFLLNVSSSTVSRPEPTFTVTLPSANMLFSGIVSARFFMSTFFLHLAAALFTQMNCSQLLSVTMVFLVRALNEGSRRFHYHGVGHSRTFSQPS